MPSPDQHNWVSYFSAIMSSCVATMALWVASRQSKTNMAKLRLDLYDKRFAIYENTLGFFQVLGGGTESLQTDAFVAAQRSFMKSYRESQFLFDDDSGVFELLGKINVDAYKVIASKTRAREMPGAHAIKLVAEANDVYATIDKSVNDLERAISPYIRFNKALI
jgi:hypothetical protein